MHGTRVNWDFLDDTYKCCVPADSSWNSWPLSCVDIVCAWPVLLFSGVYPPSVGFITGRMFYLSSFVPFHLSLYGSVPCYAVSAVLSICSLFSWLLLDCFLGLSNILKFFLCGFLVDILLRVDGLTFPWSCPLVGFNSPLALCASGTRQLSLPDQSMGHSGLFILA